MPREKDKPKDKDRRKPVEKEASLMKLMRAVVEARNRLSSSRERLRAIDLKLRGKNPGDYERQHSQALAEYVEAAGSAKVARTRLLKHLREHAA
jgi:hypothetical protein